MSSFFGDTGRFEVLSDTDNDTDNEINVAVPNTSNDSALTSSYPNPVVINQVDMRQLERMAAGVSFNDFGDATPQVFGCRGNSRLFGSTPNRAPKNCTTLCCDPDCSCTDCPECADRRTRRSRHRHGRRSRRPSLREPSIYDDNDSPTDGHGGSFGPINPSPAYLKAAKVKSLDQPSDHPLVVISLVGVLCAKLPFHLSGGHTNVLSRTYLSPFIDYLLHPGNRWTVAFWSGSMKRKEAMEVLRMLKLPTGSAEEDERDGVVGLWSKEDTRSGYDGGELCVKDLQIMWDELEQEEGIRWTAEDTVVITDYPEYCRAQPLNYVLAPSFHYRMATSAWDDQYLLMMIAVLKYLENESNFPQVIQEEKWSQEDTWTGEGKDQVSVRDVLVHQATRICAKERIVIKAAGGN